jgi:UDP-glucose 4-epimerase
MSQYLVTGGEGFIGSRIAKEVGAISYDIKSGKDILDETKLRTATTDCKGIFHCAAKISVPESIQKPNEYYTTNVTGTESVAKVANATSNKGAQKIVFSSSAAVYGETNSTVTETSPLNPKSPYAQNKIDGENILMRSSGNPESPAHIALRYFNVYGPGQSAQYAGVITFFITNALKGDDLVIYGDGNQVRDFIYIDDIVRANLAAMRYNNTSFEIFNVGSGIETTINGLAHTIIRLTNSNSKIIYKDPRPGDIIYSNADVTKAERILGWRAEVSLEEGLRKTIEYYKK